jgi:hypothetical protein
MGCGCCRAIVGARRRAGGDGGRLGARLNGENGEGGGGKTNPRVWLRKLSPAQGWPASHNIGHGSGCAATPRPSGGCRPPFHFPLILIFFFQI